MAPPTIKRSVESTWRGGLRCDVAAGNFVLIADEPESAGGSDSGPQPTELLLASVASCFTLAIAYSAKKLSITLEQLSVKATGIYDGPRFRAIHILPKIGCAKAVVDLLVEQAEKVCYVTNTLRANVDIVVEAKTANDA